MTILFQPNYTQTVISSVLINCLVIIITRISGGFFFYTKRDPRLEPYVERTERDVIGKHWKTHVPIQNTNCLTGQTRVLFSAPSNWKSRAWYLHDDARAAATRIRVAVAVVLFLPPTHVSDVYVRR